LNLLVFKLARDGDCDKAPNPVEIQPGGWEYPAELPVLECLMASPERRPWTRDELLLAINLYCRTPFGRIHMRNPEIIGLAAMLGRTPGSVGMKLANFAHIDPSLNRKGMSGGSKLDQEVWNEVFGNWDAAIAESEQISLKVRDGVQAWDESTPLPEGGTKERFVSTRTNQGFFRDMILASYDSRCCITGLPIPELLIASHIVPWAADTTNRMNPRNGLCLNALHDKAFDAGLITVDESFRVVVSSRVREIAKPDTELIMDYAGAPITLPKRFLPDQNLLEYHRTNIFAG